MSLTKLPSIVANLLDKKISTEKKEEKKTEKKEAEKKEENEKIKIALNSIHVPLLNLENFKDKTPRSTSCTLTTQRSRTLQELAFPTSRIYESNLPHYIKYNVTPTRPKNYKHNKVNQYIAIQNKYLMRLNPIFNPPRHKLYMFSPEDLGHPPFIFVKDTFP